MIHPLFETLVIWSPTAPDKVSLHSLECACVCVKRTTYCIYHLHTCYTTNSRTQSYLPGPLNILAYWALYGRYFDLLVRSSPNELWTNVLKMSDFQYCRIYDYTCLTFIFGIRIIFSPSHSKWKTTGKSARALFRLEWIFICKLITQHWEEGRVIC